MGKLNGDAKVLAEKIDSKFCEFKEYIREEMKELKKNDETIFRILAKHDKSITRNVTLIGVGAFVVATATTIIIRTMFS